MASASTFDEYEDVGLAFTESTLQEWDPKAWAESRVVYLMRRATVAQMMADSYMVVGPQATMAKAHSLVVDIATWTCRAMELTGVNRDPQWSGKQTKSMKADALRLSPVEWTEEFRADAEVAMRSVVTLGRRAAGVCRWTKAQRSASNKLANCVGKELWAAGKVEVMLNSISS